MERLMCRYTGAGVALLLALAVLTAMPNDAYADAGWFEVGDTSLRVDLQVLNDAGVIRLPINQWPLPRAALRFALENAREHIAANRAVATALARVRARIDSADTATRAGRRTILGVGATAGDPALLRQFGTSGRENGELSAFAVYGGERAEAKLRITGVANPADDRALRADGSHASLRWGNWLISANKLDRYWGPGHESSLILSNNARPLPTIMVERATAKPFDSALLSWLGPWRMSFGFSRMESQRQDIDSPLFLAWRITVMPFHDMELGLSRTAQFCGEQLECSIEVFGNLLVGNDNVGIDATPDNEPGNQMAGFDLRWSSPIGNLPYAVYSQYIGEDESSYLPAKYLAQLGVEVWKPFTDGALLQGWFEYSSTTCSANTGRGPYYNCAYNQGRFDVEGYRYLDRVIGHTADRDAENWSLGSTYTGAGGALWSAALRKSRLNRDDFDDVRNTVSSVPATYQALEFGWRGRLLGEQMSVEVGVQSIEPAGGRRDFTPFGFISWHHEFEP
jgi:hypothetical protein